MPFVDITAVDHDLARAKKLLPSDLACQTIIDADGLLERDERSALELKRAVTSPGRPRWISGVGWQQQPRRASGSNSTGGG